MSAKQYDFPVVTYRSGQPATFFRNKVVYAEQHEKIVSERDRLRTENATLRTELKVYQLIWKCCTCQPENALDQARTAVEAAKGDIE